jgi:hypothetical protein
MERTKRDPFLLTEVQFTLQRWELRSPLGFASRAIAIEEVR